MRPRTDEGPSGTLLTFSVQAVHHAADELQLVLKAEVDEIRVNQNPVRWYESRVMLQEKRGGNLRTGRT